RQRGGQFDFVDIHLVRTCIEVEPLRVRRPGDGGGVFRGQRLAQVGVAPAVFDLVRVEPADALSAFRCAAGDEQIAIGHVHHRGRVGGRAEAGTIRRAGDVHPRFEVEIAGARGVAGEIPDALALFVERADLYAGGMHANGAGVLRIAAPFAGGEI